MSGSLFDVANLLQHHDSVIELLLRVRVDAVYAASFMVIGSVGLMLIFGVMGVVNFVHGERFMLGAYYVVFACADQSYPYLLAAVMLGLVFVGLLGIAMERTLFRPVRTNPSCRGAVASCP